MVLFYLFIYFITLFIWLGFKAIFENISHFSYRDHVATIGSPCMDVGAIMIAAYQDLDRPLHVVAMGDCWILHLST